MPSVFVLLDLRNSTNRIDPLLASLSLVRDGAQQLRDFSSSRLWRWALPADGKICLQTIYRLKCSHPRICPHIHTYIHTPLTTSQNFPPLRSQKTLPNKHASNTPQNISQESLSGVLWRFRFHAESENPIFRGSNNAILFVPWTGRCCGPARSRLLCFLWDVRLLVSLGLCRNVQMEFPPVVQEMKNADKSDIECGHFTSGYRS